MTLYINNISYGVTQDRLERAFNRFGDVHVDLKKGFAFAEFVDPKEAESAMQSLQGANFSGMNIKIRVRASVCSTYDLRRDSSVRDNIVFSVGLCCMCICLVGKSFGEACKPATATVTVTDRARHESTETLTS